MNIGTSGRMLRRLLLLVAALGLIGAACTQPSGSSSTTTSSIPGNVAPIADIAASATSGYAPLTVDFDASASTDTDGTIVAWNWDLAGITTASGEYVTFPFGIGTHVVTLTVIDDLGAEASTSVSIVVTETPNVLPTASFTSSVTSGWTPLDVNFDAALSSDSDGTIVSWDWDFGGLGTASGVTSNYSFPEGVHVVSLTVTDDRGGQDTITDTITALGPPPAPTGLTVVDSGCCTWADFSWDAVAGATQYEIYMDSAIGCIASNPSGTFAGSATSGSISGGGMCWGSQYDVSIRAQANGQWGPWSPSFRMTV